MTRNESQFDGDTIWLQPKPDYFDIDEILASDQRVTCTLLSCMPLALLSSPGTSQMQALQPSGSRENRAELPVWLLEILQKSNPQRQRGRRRLNDPVGPHGVTSIHLPRVYNPALGHILEADASVCDLHKLGPYFYDLAMYLLRLDVVISEDDQDHVARTAIKTFLGRISWLMDLAAHGVHEQQPPILDKLESRLYAFGKQSQLDYKRWNSGRGHVIQVNKRTLQAINAGGRKRKLNQLK